MQIRGVVVHGKKQARELGYPTANIEYASAEHIGPGVWTCWMTIDGKSYEGLAVVGMWLLAGGEPSVEVHLIDGCLDLYAKEVAVELGHRLRPLLPFTGIDALKAQIILDIQEGRAWFSSHPQTN